MVYFPERQPDNTWVAKKIFTKRIPHTVDFQIDGAEFDLYKSVTRFVKRQSARAAADGDDPRARAVGFLMALYQRRLASSTRAVCCSLENRARRLDVGLKKAQEIARTAPPDLPDADELEEMDEGDRERLEHMLEAITLAGNAEDVRAEIAELKQLAVQAKAVETSGVGSEALAAQEPDAGARLLRPPGPAAAPLHRVQGHARLPRRQAGRVGLPRRLHPRQHADRLAGRPRLPAAHRTAVPRRGDPDPRGDRGGRRGHQPSVLQHPVQLRHPLEPQPPRTADGPHPPLRPDARTA